MNETDTFLADRRAISDARLLAFTEALLAEIPPSERPELIGDHTTIYAVGSGAPGYTVGGTLRSGGTKRNPCVSPMAR